MCDRSVSCPDCPDLFCCAEEDRSYQPAADDPKPLEPNGWADVQILDAMTGSGVWFFERWQALEAGPKQAARRIVFDGANPKDVLDLLALAFVREQAWPGSGPAATIPPDDPDQYLYRTVPPAPPYSQRLQGLIARIDNIRCGPGNHIRYQVAADHWAIYVPQTGDWLRGTKPGGRPSRTMGAEEFQSLIPSLLAYLQQVHR